MARKDKAQKQPEYEVKHASIGVAKKVAAVETRRKVSTVLVVLLLVALILGGVVYGALYFIEWNSVKISVEESSVGGLTLSDNYLFDNAKSFLSMGGPTKMDNTTYKWLDLDKIFGAEGGSANGENYIAFTFFVRNESETAVAYLAEIDVVAESKSLASAVRVLVKQGDDDIKYYARRDADGNAEKLVPYMWNSPDPADFEKVWDPETKTYVYSDKLTYEIDTLPFAEDNVNNKSVIMKQNMGLLEAQQYHKYTIVVWLEGEDRECIDEVLGGQMKLEMRLALTE